MAQGGLVVSGILTARALGPTDRGLLALVTLVPLILWQLGSLGIPLSVTYSVARSEADPRPVLGQAWRAIRIQVGVLLPLNVLAALLLSEARGREILLPALIALSVIPGHLVYQNMLAALLGLRAWRTFYALRVTPIICWIVLLLTFFLSGRLNLVTATTSYAISYGVTAIVSAALVRTLVARRHHDDRVSQPSLQWMARFGMRGLLGSASVTQTYRIDQAIVGLFLAPAALGVYTVALSLTTLPRFIAQNIGFMAYPETARRDDWRAAKRTVWYYSLLALAACGSVVVALWITAPALLPFFFGREFEPAVPVVRILFVSTLLVSVQRVLIDSARGIGRPGLGSLSELALLCTLAPAAVVLLPRAGIEGVSWALAIASAVGLTTVLLGVLRARVDGRGKTGVARATPDPARNVV